MLPLSKALPCLFRAIEMPTKKWCLQLEHSALWFFQCLRVWLLAMTVREEKHVCSRWNTLYNNIFVMFVIANVISKQALGDWGLETFTAHHLTLSWLDWSLHVTVNPCCSCTEMLSQMWLLLSSLSSPSPWPPPRSLSLFFWLWEAFYLYLLIPSFIVIASTYVPSVTHALIFPFLALLTQPGKHSAMPFVKSTVYQ